MTPDGTIDHPGDGNGRGSGTYEPSTLDEVRLLTHEPAEELGIKDPTVETYTDLNRAFHFFNERLFKGELEPCLITLRASGNSLGYFSPNRFVHADGRRTHEIALNPEAFGYQTIEQSLSTLLHEQVHQWQHQAETMGRRGYHNRDFATRARMVGLVASSTNRPGGADVGEKMGHYIDADGPYLPCVRELLDNKFRARWADRFIKQVCPEWIPGDPSPQDADAANPHKNGAPSTVADLANVLGDRVYPGGTPPTMADDPDAFVLSRPRRKDPSKCKFSCPTCSAAAWGKESLRLICALCVEPLILAPGKGQAAA